MTTATTDKDSTVRALVTQWTSMDELLSSLPEDAWSTPSALPGWTVQDIVSHVIGTESMLEGEQAPEPDVDVTSLPHVRNDIAAVNEHWVLALREHTPARMLDRFRDIVSRRIEALRAMSQEDFDAPSWTPAGQATYGRFMRIRLFDCWLHEQDIRDAVGMPGNQEGPCAEGALEEIVGALGYLVGKRAEAPDGSRLTIELTGPVSRTLHVAVDGRASVVPELSGPATSTLRLSSDLFTRLAGGRVSPEEHLTEVDVQGDAELGAQVVRNLRLTI
ncbi:maleylpyruvate isomerase family mycothiol-dependent enzyme [Haloechinothrix sp. YIM 98757]|uniref:Maleylpyruvate isomerase family mycothiol-dependent enzyme n=1 Tax=Haloechinothrix aidingensis TaxID=2752311 RepID=A0A838A7N0_9PSEU|nr:maleylpyruvate isomerase family mycothiol-dependent enzyme [Haloechinothrix aidingensis]MBA0124309.1 maleylpyruvate isomerase family mycothiol-dependent enzyme [Haloechinothrix aidingensis]